jgi:hypothetical protein
MNSGKSSKILSGNFPESLLFVNSLPSLKSLLLLAVIAASAACVKVDLNRTDHPAHAQIVSLTTDWTDRGEGIAVPDPYMAAVGEWAAALHGVTNAIDLIFTEGAYHIHVWNEAANITVSGETATADYPAGAPGWLFTGSQDVTLERDRDHSITVEMHQRVRELTLVLEPAGDAKDRITGVDATLSGVAGAVNIDSGNSEGAPQTVALNFERRSDGRYYATIRILGVTGSDQNLAFTLHFADGNPSPQTLDSDLSDRLAAFNADRKTPLTLAAILTVTPSQSGVLATIDNWTDTGGTIIAN